MNIDPTEVPLVTRGANDELTFIDLVKDAFKFKWLIVTTTAFFFGVSYIYSQSLPDRYRSTVVLVPASNSAIPQASTKLGGLASLAGISVGSSGDVSNHELALELLRSWSFLESFIQKHGIEVSLFAAKAWNKDSGELVYNPEIYDVSHSQWLGKYTKTNGPSSWELYEKLRANIVILRDPRSGFIRLSVEHVSPDVAKNMVDLLVQGINEFVKNADKLDAEASIKYLKIQIEKTALSEMRDVFYQLIEEQTKKLMLAEISSEYALKTVSSARAVEQPFKPNRPIIIALGTGLGLLLSLLGSILYSFLRTR